MVSYFPTALYCLVAIIIRQNLKEPGLNETALGPIVLYRVLPPFGVKSVWVDWMRPYRPGKRLRISIILFQKKI